MTAARAWVRRHREPLLIAVLILLAIVSFRIVNGLSEYRLLVPLDSADGLYPGSDVLIAGAKAGTVRDIGLDGGQALLTIAVDDAYAPLHSNARLTVRPKSLLGEKYIALDPGSGDTLGSGSRLREVQVARAVDLQDVVNTLDQPTREKLRTLLIELGGGLAGRGLDTNQTLAFGRQDMDDLASISDTLAARDAELQQVIQGLDQVTAELAKSDRRVELGELIRNSERLLHSLAQQDAQIKHTLAEANAALSRTDTALTGTAAQLNGIFQEAPRTVTLLDALSADLANGMDHTLSGDNLRVFDTGMKFSTNIFGARDGQGYATRITVVVGACSAGNPCPNPSALLPRGAAIPNTFDDVVGVLLGGPK